MDTEPEDLLWPHFQPLWNDLQGAGENIMVAGGYGLFLKQKWLNLNPTTPIAVPLAQWLDPTPRVTKDFDIVIGLELIANEESQRAMLGALSKHDFKVTDNPRWQFNKQLDAQRAVLVDLHAPVPSKDVAGFEMDKIRVKRKPSLGEAGIHGRQNPEAVGCDRLPLQFEIDGVKIKVPNPVTWSVMKLTAMRDRWERAQQPDRPAESRDFSREQAIKHAIDVFRVMAMVTRDESDGAATILNEIRQTPQYVRAVAISSEVFGAAEGWGRQVIANKWQPGDIQIIENALAAWFT